MIIGTTTSGLLHAEGICNMINSDSARSCFHGCEDVGNTQFGMKRAWLKDLSEHKMYGQNEEDPIHSGKEGKETKTERIPSNLDSMLPKVHGKAK